MASRAAAEPFDLHDYMAAQMRARQEGAADEARPFFEWAMLTPEPGVGDLDFDRFPYLRELYGEEFARAEEAVIVKSTQIGASALAWRWAARQSDQFGDTVLYIFPTDTHVTEFGDERIEPSIEASPYLRRRVRRGDVRHKRLKKIGLGFLHLRGSNSKAGAQSVAAQALVFDEYDHLDPVNLPQIERRITGAEQIGKKPKIRRLGTPTIPDFGIDLAYKHSDRRVWQVVCDGCGLQQEVTWEENVRWTMPGDERVYRAGRDAEYSDPKVLDRVWRACRACDHELDVRRGEWIVTNPGAPVVGYYVPRLIVPFTGLRQIVIASRETNPAKVETFEQNDLGRAFSPSEASLSVTDLAQACELGGEIVHGYVGRFPTTMGVDVAGERALSVRIDEQLPAEFAGIPNPRRALWIGEVNSFEEVAKLGRVFRCSVIAVDSNPERRFAKTLRSSFAPGTVVLVEYDGSNPDAEPIKIETGPAGTPLEGVPLKVRVNRTEAIDAMMDSIRQKRNYPLRNPPPKWMDQMRALHRRTEITPSGKVRRVYVTTGTAGDDYAHADAYCLVATELWRLRAGVQALQPNERPLPDEALGFRRVRLEGDHDDYRPGFQG